MAISAGTYSLFINCRVVFDNTMKSILLYTCPSGGKQVHSFASDGAIVFQVQNGNLIVLPAGTPMANTVKQFFQLLPAPKTEFAFWQNTSTVELIGTDDPRDEACSSLTIEGRKRIDHSHFDLAQTPVRISIASDPAGAMTMTVEYDQTKSIFTRFQEYK